MKSSKRLLHLSSFCTFTLAVVSGITLLMVTPAAEAAEATQGISATSKAIRDKIDLTSPSGCRHIYGFNYQPSWGSNGLTVWGEKFDAKKYREELSQGKKYFPKFNAVRIWLSWSAYREDPKQFIQKFKQAVDICGELDLLVIPVVFNRWVGRPLWDLVEDSQITADFDATFTPFITDLVTSMRGDSRILAWDLCNEPPLHAEEEVQWLKNIRNKVKQLDPNALICIGTVTVDQTSKVAELQDILTPHLYYHYHPGIPAYCQLAKDQKKPLISTECCWGALDDAERVKRVRETLSLLKKNQIGFFPHALHESYVADLHRAQYGFVDVPGYMSFIHMDGSLRAGHDVYNEFTE